MHDVTASSPPTRSPGVALLGRVLGVVIGLLLALAVIELAGRAVLGFDRLPGWSQDFNNHVGYELRPYDAYTYTSASGEFDTQVEHNARGLHDVEHTLSKPDGVFRILILADSYGQAREVPLADNFARRLESLLNQTAPDGTTVEVINAGHFGLGTTQEYLYYVHEGHRYAPDLILMGFYAGNDVIDNHAPLIRAFEDIDAVDFPYFTPDGTLHQPGMKATRRALSWLRHNLYTANMIAGALTGTQHSDQVTVGQNTISDRALRVAMGIYLPPDAIWQDAWNVTGHAMAELNTAAEQDGARLAVFVIPDRRQVYDDAWQATLERVPDLDPATLDRDRPTQTIMTRLAALAIPALNLLDPFRAADERLYFEVDGHFNVAGHTLVAHELARWLRDSNLVPAEGE